MKANITCQKKAGKYMIQYKDSRKLPIIGHQPASCTQTPNFYQESGSTYVDLPGNLDTKGDVQEILNAFSCSKVYQKAKQYKLVIVIEQFSLYSQRGGTLAPLIQRLEEKFEPDFESLAHSCCLVVSKIDTESYTEDDIVCQIQDIIKSNTYFSKAGSKGSEFLKTILKNRKIVLFPLPMQVNQAVVANIEKEIQKINYYTLRNDGKVSLSSSSKVLIGTWNKELLAKIKEQQSKIAQKIQAKYLNKTFTINQANNELKILQNFMGYESKLANPNDYPITLLVNHFTLAGNQAASSLVWLGKWKQLCSIHEDIQKNATFECTLFSTIKNCKADVQNKIKQLQYQQMIAQQQQRNRKEAQRKQQERINQQLQYQRKQKQAEDRQKAQNQRRERQLNEQKRIQAAQAQILRQQIANTPVYHQPRRRRNDCQIM